MPDEPHLFEYLTIAEHLQLMARLYGVDDFPRRSLPSERFKRGSRGSAEPPLKKCRRTNRGYRGWSG